MFTPRNDIHFPLSGRENDCAREAITKCACKCLTIAFGQCIRMQEAVLNIAPECVLCYGACEVVCSRSGGHKTIVNIDFEGSCDTVVDVPVHIEISISVFQSERAIDSQLASIIVYALERAYHILANWARLRHRRVKYLVRSATKG